MPPQFGLYAAFGALIGYALFGTARQVVTGPSATVAAVSASVIALLAASGSPDWIAYTATLAIAAGLIYLLLGLLRMGWISTFLSGAVLEGFVFAFGIGLIVDQSHKILSVEKEARRYQVSRRDFAAFVAAGIGLFFVGVLSGVLIGVVLSLILLIATASRSPVRRLSFDKENDVYVDIAQHPEAEAMSGVVVVEIRGPLFFADADSFRAAVLEMVTEAESHTLVIDLAAASFIDMDGAEVLGKLATQLRARGSNVLLSRIESTEVDLLRRSGVLDTIGEENVYESVRAAMAAAQGHASSP
jgi:anti-anti-sigma factor